MNKLSLLILLPTLLLLPGLAQADSSRESGCRKKEQAIELKLEYAKKYNRPGQIRGLEEALEKVRMYCKDNSLRSELELKVVDKQEKVFEREEELAEARAEGKSAKKIAKLERKLQDAKAELLEAEQKRDAHL